MKHCHLIISHNYHCDMNPLKFNYTTRWYVKKYHYFTSIDYKKECKMKHGAPYCKLYV